MKILSGYSEDLSHNNWARGDVELDSADLEDLARDHGFELHGLTLAQKYGILSTEVERLITIKYIRDVQTKAPGSRDLASLQKRLQDVTDRAAKHIDLAKRVSHGGSGEETS